MATIVNEFENDSVDSKNNLTDFCFDRSQGEIPVIKITGNKCNTSERIYINENSSVGKNCKFVRTDDIIYNEKYFGNCESDPLYWKKINNGLFVSGRKVTGDLVINVDQNTSVAQNNTLHSSNVFSSTVISDNINATTQVIETMGNILNDNETVLLETTVNSPDTTIINKEIEMEHTWLLIFIIIFMFGNFVGYLLNQTNG